MTDPEDDALNAGEANEVAGGEQESGAGYGNHAGQPPVETPVDEGLHGGESEGAGSDQR